MSITLVAKTAIRGRTVVQEADPNKPGDRAKTKAKDISVGRAFEVETEDEAKELIRAGAARRQTEDEKLRAKGAEMDDEVDLSNMTKAELEAEAAKRGIATDGKTKAQILAALQA